MRIKISLIIIVLSLGGINAQNVLFLTSGLNQEYQRVFEEEAMGFLFEEGYIVFNDAISQILTESMGRTENILSFARMVEANYVVVIYLTDNEAASSFKIQVFRTEDGKLLQEADKMLIFKKDESVFNKVKRWGKEIGILMKGIPKTP